MLLYSPPHPQEVASLSQSSCVSPIELTEGRKRVGEEPNHTTTRKPGPLQIIQSSLGWENGRECGGALQYH